LVVLAVLVVQPATAQTEQPTRSELEERVEVHLHLIDICATDRKGRPITGLDREDFRLRIDDREREIVSLDAATESRLPEALTAQGVTGALESESLPRWVLIVLDADRISRTHRTAALDTARALVDEAAPADRFGVAVIQNGAARLVQDFAAPSDVNRGLFDNASLLHTNSSDLRIRLAELDDLMRSCAGAANQSACAFTRSAEFGAIVRRESSQAVDAVSGLIAAMTPIPGRKALVLFSDGIVLEPGEVMLDAVRRYTPDAAERLHSRLQDPEPLDYDALIAEATRAGVTFFSMRTGRDLSAESRGASIGALHRESVTPGSDPFRTAQRFLDQSLRSIAEATGGRAIFTPLTPRVAEDMLDRLSGVYTLGVRAASGDSARSRVKVSLTGTKGRVQVWKRLPSFAGPRRPLSISLEAPAAPGEELDGLVPVRLGVLLNDLAAEEDEETGAPSSRIAVFARLLDLRGESMADYYRILEVPRGQASSEHFFHPFIFRVAPGRYLAQVFVSDLIGGGTGTTSTEIATPGLKPARNPR
jgi:VWFA-related protein